MDEANGDDRVTLPDGLVDQLEFVVLDVGAGARDRTDDGNADQRGLDGTRIVEVFIFESSKS